MQLHLVELETFLVRNKN